MNFEIDKWLTRLSHVAQIGLLLSAVFTIWYTVIPLYGKSILEEQVAEKTIELNKINDHISKQYRALKQSYIKDLQLGYVITCVIRPLSKMPEYAERIDHDLSPCFSGVKDSVLKDSLLNEVDRDKVNLAHTMIITYSEAIRNKKRSKFSEIEKIQINEIYLLPELKGYTKESFDFVKKSRIMLGEDFVEEEFRARKIQAKSNLISQYQDELSDLIKKNFSEI